MGVVTGNASERETAAAGRLVAAVNPRVGVVPMTREMARALTPLGFRATPFLVVLDPQGRIRLASPAPQGYEATRDFDLLLDSLLPATAPARGA